MRNDCPSWKLIIARKLTLGYCVNWNLCWRSDCTQRKCCRRNQFYYNVCTYLDQNYRRVQLSPKSIKIWRVVNWVWNCRSQIWNVNYFLLIECYGSPPPPQSLYCSSQLRGLKLGTYFIGFEVEGKVELFLFYCCCVSSTGTGRFKYQW